MLLDWVRLPTSLASGITDFARHLLPQSMASSLIPTSALSPMAAVQFPSDWRHRPLTYDQVLLGSEKAGGGFVVPMRT